MNGLRNITIGGWLTCTITTVMHHVQCRNKPTQWSTPSLNTMNRCLILNPSGMTQHPSEKLLHQVALRHPPKHCLQQTQSFNNWSNRLRHSWHYPFQLWWQRSDHHEVQVVGKRVAPTVPLNHGNNGISTATNAVSISTTISPDAASRPCQQERKAPPKITLLAVTSKSTNCG